MDNSPFHKLSRVLWAAAVALVVLLAMYVSIGRVLVGSLQDFQGEVLHALLQLLPLSLLFILVDRLSIGIRSSLLLLDIIAVTVRAGIAAGSILL